MKLPHCSDGVGLQIALTRARASTPKRTQRSHYSAADISGHCRQPHSPVGIHTKRRPLHLPTGSKGKATNQPHNIHDYDLRWRHCVILMTTQQPHHPCIINHIHFWPARGVGGVENPLAPLSSNNHGRITAAVARVGGWRVWVVLRTMEICNHTLGLGLCTTNVVHIRARPHAHADSFSLRLNKQSPGKNEFCTRVWFCVCVCICTPQPASLPSRVRQTKEWPPPLLLATYVSALCS